MAPKRAPSAKLPRSTGRASKRGQFIKAFAKTSSLYISVMLCLVLLAITVLMLILNLKKWEKEKTFYHAVRKVRDFVISENPEAHVLNDMAVIELCQTYVEELLVWSRKTDQLQSAIFDIRYRLNRDWEAHKGFIYLFYKDRMIWSEAKHFCQRYGSHLVTIENKYEEEFIESHLRDTTVSYWVGGIKMYPNSPWKWIENEETISPVDVYWAYGEPQETKSMNCIVVLRKCPNPLKCWHSHNCFTFNRPLCKKRPEKNWFD